MTDDELKRKEKKLREWLAATDREARNYARWYKAWWTLREEGMQRGLFRFFVSGNREQVAAI